ncbi:MAG: PQQ-dependent sugar dehydrogenase [Bacteroidetes bacterium]|nr:PQQ-dependent sugar dehydrogenase [Bacteroidota bacterium]
MRSFRQILVLIALVSAGFLRAQVYTTTTLISSLQNPVAFAISPDNRIFLTQKGDGSIPAVAGSATIRVYTLTGTFLSTFYDLSDSVNSDFERGLLGIALDPSFTTNHYVYVYYVHYYNASERIRIVRFTEVSNAGTNPQVIFDLDITSYNIAGNHVGGNVHFRPSDPTHIYFTIGDLAYQQTNPTLNYANKLTKPFGKVLRIGKDPITVGMPTYNVHGVGTCGANIPTDNPYYDDGNIYTGNCDIIWSYGHRNPFDFCFSPVSDSMYVSENGLNTWDEINMIHKGANYGWATCEGRMMNSSTTVPCNLTGDVLPMDVWGAPLPALTGIVYYSSSVMPEFNNHLLVTDNDYARIYDLTLGNPPAYDTVLSRTQWQDMPGGHTTLMQGPEGCIYVMRGGYEAGTGAVKRICPQGLGTGDFINPYFTMQQSNPNPFSVSTTLTYSMKQEALVRIALYDVYGKEVAVLVDGQQTEGSHTYDINAATLNLAPGMYFCYMESNTYAQSLKLTVVK